MPRAYDFEELESLALAIIQQQPGINLSRLTTRLGLPSYRSSRDGYIKPNPAAQKACDRLIKRGAIEIRQEPIHETPLIYPAGYEAPRQRPLFEPVKGHRPASVRVLTPTDPDYPDLNIKSAIPDVFRPKSLRDRPSQAPQVTTYKFKSKPPTHQGEPQMSSSPTEVQHAIREAIAEMIAAGEELSQKQICELAGAHHGYFSSNLKMKGEYLRAIEQIRQSKYSSNVDAAVLQSRIQELEAALDLESKAKETLQRALTEQQESAKETIQGLRKQLLEQGNRLSRLEEQRPAAKLDNRGLLEALRELAAQEQRTIDRCTSDLQALQDQIEQTRRDRAAAERHLDTFNAQIERLEEQVEVKASTNGHHKVAAGV